MVTKGRIEEILKPRLNYILLVAESSLHESQFRAFRKLVLDCFGKSGFEKDLARIFEGEFQGKDRDGQEYIAQKKGCIMVDKFKKN